MPGQIPATFLIPDDPTAPLEITFRHEALTMAVVDRDQFTNVARDWDVTGVYLLFGPSAEDAPGRYAVYVGKAAPGNVAARIQSHIRKREGWDRALLVTRSTADGFNSTDVGWLEGRLHQTLVEADDAELLNSATPGNDTISAWDREALERVVATIRGVMRVLGYRPDPTPASVDTSTAPAPSPVPADDAATAGLDVDRLHAIISVVKPGEWTAYGDVAEAAGTHPRGLGSHIRTCTSGDAPEWRVLDRRGRSRPGFVWRDEDRDESQLDVLTDEGVRFDHREHADPDQRIDAQTLLDRIGSSADGERDGSSRADAWLLPLYEAALIMPGTPLHARYKGETFHAVASADGEVEVTVGGRSVVGSPSYTARSIVGYEINGWTFWRTTDHAGDEHTLAELRDRVEGH